MCPRPQFPLGILLYDKGSFPGHFHVLKTETERIGLIHSQVFGVIPTSSNDRVNHRAGRRTCMINKQTKQPQMNDLENLWVFRCVVLCESVDRQARRAHTADTHAKTSGLPLPLVSAVGDYVTTSKPDRQESVFSRCTRERGPGTGDGKPTKTTGYKG